jgi:hypothetical protein
MPEHLAKLEINRINRRCFIGGSDARIIMGNDEQALIRFAALATALAKAQIELANPEKSLTGTIEPQGGESGARHFRYAPLSSGLEIVCRTLGQHEMQPCRPRRSTSLPAL